MTTDDTEFEEVKAKIIGYLSSLEGKGADTTMHIAKAIGIKRRACSKALNRMELDGVIQPAGVAAGVAGYKLKS